MIGWNALVSGTVWVWLVLSCFVRCLGFVGTLLFGFAGWVVYVFVRCFYLVLLGGDLLRRFACLVLGVGLL